MIQVLQVTYVMLFDISGKYKARVEENEGKISLAYLTIMSDWRAEYEECLWLLLTWKISVSRKFWLANWWI